jgi:hypothetical protein
VLERTLKIFRRPLIYIQVHPDHFTGRLVGEHRTIRRDCHALDNRRNELKDFTRIKKTLRDFITELAPGFSVHRPQGLMHFIPTVYVPTQNELVLFKETAEKCGVSFCWLSKWESAHTDGELSEVQRAL